VRIEKSELKMEIWAGVKYFFVLNICIKYLKREDLKTYAK